MLESDQSYNKCNIATRLLTFVRCLSVQVLAIHRDQIGRGFSFLCQNLLTKLAKQFGDFLGCFEDINYQLITVVATFWTPFRKNWATFYFKTQVHCVHPYSCPGSLVYRHMPSTKGLCDKVQQLNLIDFLIIVYLNGFDQVHNVQSTFLST